MTETDKKNWLMAHADTVILIITVLSSVLTAVLWMNSRFNELEKDIAIIKTVLVMKNIMPSDMCKKNEDSKKA